MKRTLLTALLAISFCLGMNLPPVHARPQPTNAQNSANQGANQGGNQSANQGGNQSSPLYRITVVARTTKAINYSHAKGSTPVDFKGTVLMPFAKGEAKVEQKKGVVSIS